MWIADTLNFKMRSQTPSNSFYTMGYLYSNTFIINKNHFPQGIKRTHKHQIRFSRKHKTCHYSTVCTVFTSQRIIARAILILALTLHHCRSAFAEKRVPKYLVFQHENVLQRGFFESDYRLSIGMSGTVFLIECLCMYAVTTLYILKIDKHDIIISRDGTVY